MTYQWNTASPEETIALAKRIGERLRPGDCIAYRGDLGAGKTTFTRGLAIGMGLGDCVTSPTFALVHEYGEPPLAGASQCAAGGTKVGGEPPLAGASQCAASGTKVGGEPPRLIHFDMYRIMDETELETTGFYDYPQDECVFAVEWSENIEAALPPHTMHLTLTRTGDESRTITLEGDERFADIGT